MARYVLVPDASSLSVWTEKEGLLSPVAHDLEILATGITVVATLEGGRFSVKLAVPVAGLRVRGAVKRGVVSPLSAKDTAEVEKTMRGTVLDAAKTPEIVYAAEGTVGADLDVSGDLSLNGKTLPLPVSVHVSAMADGTRDERRVEGVVRFKQTAFGVKPYSAMLGTLRVKDEVRVSWSLLLRKD
jgi:hypothetical protein